MSDTSELLTTYMAAGMVGEDPRHLQLVPLLEGVQNNIDAKISLTPAQNIGSSALSELAPEFVESDPAPVNGIRRPGTTLLGSAPEDEFGQTIYAISDGDPDTVGRLMVQDWADTLTRRHSMNDDRFVAATLTIGKLASTDAQLAEYQEERMIRSLQILPNPTVPRLFDRHVAKATTHRVAGQVKDTSRKAIQRYLDKPLIKDQIK